MATPASSTANQLKYKARSLACGVCRKKKIKCGGGPAPCSNCVHSGTECVFPTGSKPRRTPIRSGRRIDGLENRLDQIEALLNMGADHSLRPETSPSPIDSTPANSPGVRDSMQRADVRNPTYYAPDVLHDQEVKSNGRSHSSILTHPAAHSPPVSQDDHVWATRQMDNAQVPNKQPLSLETTTSLPSFNEAFDLASKYFTTMNRWLPLFNENFILAEMHKNYANLAAGDSALWAAVNVVLALAHQLISHQLSGQAAIDNEDLSLRYLQNARSAVDRLLMRPPDTLSAQALLGIAKVLQSTSTPHVATMYLAMASRQIYQLGLHRMPSPDQDSQKLDWQRRLFWYTYSTDKDISLRLDQPPTLNDQDLDLSLPEWIPSDNLGFLPTLDVSLRINYFRHHIDLAIIQSRIYATLYSIQSLRKDSSVARTEETVCTLSIKLETWKNQIPLEFEASALIQMLPAPSVIAMVVLHFRYFNCLCMTHRLSYWKVNHLEIYKQSLDEIFFDPCPTQSLCLRAARTSLHLFNVLPHHSVPRTWLVVDYLISGILLLLTAIIYKSTLSLCRQDYELVSSVIQNLGPLAQHGDTERLQHIRARCVELQNAAKNLLDEAQIAREGESPGTFLNSVFGDDEIFEWL